MVYFFILSFLICINNAALDYPPTMPNDPGIVSSLTGNRCPLVSDLVETPLAARVALCAAICNWNCVAFYDEQALDFITLERPIVDVPVNYHTWQNKALCVAYCRPACLSTMNLYELTFTPTLAASFQALYVDAWQMDPVPLQNLDPEVLACNGDTDCLRNYIIDNDYEPDNIAHYITYEIYHEYQNDGWNQDGSLRNNDQTCSANCKKYGDYSSYFPVNFDYDVSEFSEDDSSSDSGKGRGRGKGNNNNQCDLRGDEMHWQPLYETDNYGFFFRQEHVVPFIGEYAKRYLYNDSAEFPLASDPNYNYFDESLLLFERMERLANNDTQKILIEFFDDKCLARAGIQRPYRLILSTLGIASWEDYTLYSLALAISESEAVLLSWYNKIYYDLIRPTTVIQQCFYDQDINIWVRGQGLQTIKGQDFEPFIRTMPHSEYISASACICQAYADVTQIFLDDIGMPEQFRAFTLALPPEFYTIEGEPANETFIYSWNSPYDYSNSCAYSRLWGGMHFTESIHASQDICSDLGRRAWVLANYLKNNTSYTDPFF